MRSLQRDALVAYILHQMRSHPESAHIDTPDKLFEYFLMDVQMDPCMQTSRIRHALSSVQLFIERCLMNLEPRVSPAAINAKQWEWMKRYRVWEANRKVYLFPENWLEPELRDDKSPFFKEIESELLQSDITEDAASDRAAELPFQAGRSRQAGAVRHLPYSLPIPPMALVRSTMSLPAPRARTANTTTGAMSTATGRRGSRSSWTSRTTRSSRSSGTIACLLFWLRLLRKGPDAVSKPSPGTKLTEFDNG